MDRSALAARILKTDGVLLLVVALIHFAATPFALRFVSSQSTPEAFVQIEPPFLLSFSVVGILLVPIGLSTVYCAESFRRGERWARVICGFNALGVFPLPVARATKCVAGNFIGTGCAQTDSQDVQVSGSNYDKAIFRDPVPSAELEFLNHYARQDTKRVLRDKQFHKLMRRMIPDLIFHYGWDMMIPDALEKVLADSQIPVQTRDGRYVEISGRSGPYLRGRGFLWIDMQDGIALGGFYFHPTNGEPTPTLTVFSRQVKEDTLKMSLLPPAFAEDLARWSAQSNVPQITTRYFIGDLHKKILLEHDEDYCAAPTAPADCQQMNADAADIDLEAAYYLDQTNHATNATAWMIDGPDQVAWIQIRENTCRAVADRIGCRIRITRERTRVIINRHSVGPNAA